MEKFSVIQRHSEVVSDKELSDIINIIKSGDYKEVVEQVRSLRAEGKERESDRLKKSLPGFTSSGTFGNRRKASNLLTYSQVLLFDWDNPQGQDPDIIRKKIMSIPEVLFCFSSPNPNRLKFAVRVNTTADKHSKMYVYVKKYFEKHLDIPIDTAKDISRLCYFSYDPNIYYNPKAPVFKLAGDDVASSSSEKDVNGLFAEIKNKTDKLSEYKKGNRNKYVYLFACNANRYGIDEAKTLLFVSKKFSDLGKPELVNVVRSAYGNIAEYGVWSEEFRKRKAEGAAARRLEKIEEFLNANYKFTHNVVTGKIEYMDYRSGITGEMEDRDLFSLFRLLVKHNFRISERGIKNLLESNFSRSYNPFVDFLNSLGKWNGKTDYIKQLADTVKTDSDELFYMCLKKFLVAMVGSWYDDEVINQTVLVLVGEQGDGKSTWVKRLVPEGMKKYYAEGGIDPNKRDDQWQLSINMIYNMDELSTLTRSAMEAVKAMITSDSFQIRLPYGYFHKTLPRRTSFTGTVNDEEFLSDTTGNRRWLAFNIKSIEGRGHHNVDMRKVYQQAFQLFKDGFQYWFDKAEIGIINTHTERFRQRTVEEELLLQWFEPVTEDKATHKYTPTEMLNIIAQQDKVKNVAISTYAIRSLGKALRKHGFLHRPSNGRNTFLARLKSPLEAEGDTFTTIALSEMKKRDADADARHKQMVADTGEQAKKTGAIRKLLDEEMRDYLIKHPEIKPFHIDPVTGERMELDPEQYVWDNEKGKWVNRNPSLRG